MVDREESRESFIGKNIGRIFVGSCLAISTLSIAYHGDLNNVRKINGGATGGTYVSDENHDGEADRTEVIIPGGFPSMPIFYSRTPTNEERDWYRTASDSPLNLF